MLRPSKKNSVGLSSRETIVWTERGLRPHQSWSEPDSRTESSFKWTDNVNTKRTESLFCWSTIWSTLRGLSLVSLKINICENTLRYKSGFCMLVKQHFHSWSVSEHPWRTWYGVRDFFPYDGFGERFLFSHILLKHSGGNEATRARLLAHLSRSGSSLWCLALSLVSPNVPRGFPLNYTLGCPWRQLCYPVFICVLCQPKQTACSLEGTELVIRT